MKTNNISWIFYLVDKCGRDFDQQTGDEFIQTYDVYDYDYKNFTLDVVIKELKNDCSNFEKTLGKDFFVKSIIRVYFNQEHQGTTDMRVSTDFIDQRYVWVEAK